MRDLNEKLCAKLGKLFDGEVSMGIRDVEGKMFIRSGVALNQDTFFDKMKEDPNVNFAALDSTDEWVEDKRKANIVRRMFGNYKQKYFQLEAELRHEKSKLTMGDELQPGIYSRNRRRSGYSARPLSVCAHHTALGTLGSVRRRPAALSDCSTS